MGSICFSCGNDLAPTPAGPANATAFHGAPSYGSDHDLTGDLEINVCDTCLTERRDRVNRVITTRTTTVRREPWNSQ